MKLSTNDGVLLDNPSLYKKFIGKRLYLYVFRPDITYIVHHFSQFLQNPRVPHMVAVQRILQYLKATACHGLYFLLSQIFILMLIEIVIGGPVLILIEALLACVYCLVLLLYLGNLENIKLFFVPLQKLNFELLQTLPMRFLG